MQTKKYWEKRAIDDLLMSERSVLDFEKDLKQSYTVTLSEIKKDIQAFYTRYAQQNKITYSEARRRLDASEYKEFQALVSKWSKDAESENLSKVYLQYLQALSKKKYITRLESLEADIRYEIESLESQKLETVTDLLETNYEVLFYLNQFDISKGTQIEVKFNTIDKKGIEKAVNTRWAQYNYSKNIWADRDKLIRTLQVVIPQSFSRGLNSKILGDMIAKELEVSRNRGRTLARTEVNRICNLAALDSYINAGITQYEYLATLDSRTSDICRSLDGSIFNVAEAQIGLNMPPMHPNCRSTTIAYFEDDDIEERIARDSDENNIKVPRRMSQEEYVKKYIPKDRQDKILNFIKKYSKSE